MKVKFNIMRNYKWNFSFSTIDPYFILNIDKRSNFDEIKKQYLKLASEYHPDKNKSKVIINSFLTYLIFKYLSFYYYFILF